MSRPPGLPERPPSGPPGDSFRQYPPSSNYGGNFLRPLSRDDNYRPRSPPREHNYREDMYQFRGNHPRYDDNRQSSYGDTDSYRPSRHAPDYPLDHSRDRPPRYDYPSDYSRDYPRSGRDDGYRSEPQPPYDFSFRRDLPPGVDLDRNFYSQPHESRRGEFNPINGYDRSARNGPPFDDFYRPAQRHDQRDRNDRHRNNRQGRPWFPTKAAERPFLKTNRDPTPELMEGMDEVDTKRIKFRAFEDLSDSEEADMDFSEGETSLNGDTEEPKKKQARTDEERPDANDTPKWSNPDPYTALPPPDESLKKKKDVVKLIRKARVAAKTDEATKPDYVADDFISFGFDDEAKNGAAEGSDADEDFGAGVPGAPTGPKGYSHRDTIQGKPDRTIESRPAPTLEISSDPALGNRKRTYDDQIKGPPPPRKLQMKPGRGEILEEWRIRHGVNSSPWCTVDHSVTENIGFWLHKEILDFYDHVKPQDFEEAMRFKILDNLRKAIPRTFPDADIHPFGSYPAGLYLPTADMDLVLCSKSYLTRNNPVYHSKRTLFKFKTFLERNNLAAHDSIELILHAKVPLVKYVDRDTGLKVDVSFENDTGLVANSTFQNWKKTFPAMPILVTIIKQFLAMRGLNEPVNGGIGGFSVICLVVSLLQLMPQIQSYNMVPEHHLGEILMEFLDLYGNEFNFKTTAIQFDPPGYVSKTRVDQIVYRSYDRLSIIDPNNPGNDIAGGSSNTATIVKAFSQAFKDLQTRIGELNQLPIDQRRNASILSVILGGDYETFEIQRQHLWNIYERSGLHGR